MGTRALHTSSASSSSPSSNRRRVARRPKKQKTRAKAAGKASTGADHPLPTGEWAPCALDGPCAGTVTTTPPSNAREPGRDATAGTVPASSWTAPRPTLPVTRADVACADLAGARLDVAAADATGSCAGGLTSRRTAARTATQSRSSVRKHNWEDKQADERRKGVLANAPVERQTATADELAILEAAPGHHTDLMGCTKAQAIQKIIANKGNRNKA